MRLLALLNFYDERVEDLARYVQSVKAAGADEIVAVDGRYALYPAAAAASSVKQLEMLRFACRQLDVRLTLHVPAGPWEGNEPQKRNTLFELALTRSVPDVDWWLVLDTDEVLRQPPPDLKDRLTASQFDVAELRVCDTVALRANRPNWPAYFTQRRLFRAQPLHLTNSHAEYFTADGRHIGLDPLGDPCLDLTDVTVSHEPQRRQQARQVAKADYYRAREASGVECGVCPCGQPAIERLERNWRVTDTGPVAELVEMCGACAARTRRRNEKRMARLGINPDTVAHRYGKAPAA